MNIAIIWSVYMDNQWQGKGGMQIPDLIDMARSTLRQQLGSRAHFGYVFVLI